jgi:hypothetical protein
MAQITLSVADLQRLVEFCAKNELKRYFIAKDQGAYLGASTGKDNNVIFYFAGCNPEKDANFYDNAHDKFGGDDFGEQLELEHLLAMIGRIHAWEQSMQAQGKKYTPIRAIRWNVTKTSISMKAI